MDGTEPLTERESERCWGAGAGGGGRHRHIHLHIQFALDMAERCQNGGLGIQVNLQDTG